MILLATITGGLVITNISIAARLSLKTDSRYSLLINYIFGLIGAILIILALHNGFNTSFSTLPLWAFSGGLIGVIVILVSNHVLPQIRAFEMTILVFTGQIVMGYFIDTVRGNLLSPKQLIGLILIMFGLYIYSGRIKNILKGSITSN
jgi:uncharacterized membrane protein YdcZ (DUF606 family)